IGAQDSNSAKVLRRPRPHRCRASVNPVNRQLVAPDEPVVGTDIDLDPTAPVIDFLDHPLCVGRRWSARHPPRNLGLPALATIFLQGADETIDLALELVEPAPGRSRQDVPCRSGLWTGLGLVWFFALGLIGVIPGLRFLALLLPGLGLIG